MADAPAAVGVVALSARGTAVGPTAGAHINTSHRPINKPPSSHGVDYGVWRISVAAGLQPDRANPRIIGEEDQDGRWARVSGDCPGPWRAVSDSGSSHVGVPRLFGQQKKGRPRRDGQSLEVRSLVKSRRRWVPRRSKTTSSEICFLRAHPFHFVPPLRISRVQTLKCGFVKALALGIALLALVVGAAAGSRTTSAMGELDLAGS